MKLNYYSMLYQINNIQMLEYTFARGSLNRDLKAEGKTFRDELKEIFRLNTAI